MGLLFELYPALNDLVFSFLHCSSLGLWDPAWARARLARFIYCGSTLIMSAPPFVEPRRFSSCFALIFVASSLCFSVLLLILAQLVVEFKKLVVVV